MERATNAQLNFTRAQRVIVALYSELKKVHHEIDEVKTTLDEAQQSVDSLLNQQEEILQAVYLEKEAIIEMTQSKLRDYRLSSSVHAKSLRKILKDNGVTSEGNTFATIRVELAQFIATQYEKYLENLKSNCRFGNPEDYVHSKVKNMLVRYLSKINKEDYPKHGATNFQRYLKKIKSDAVSTEGEVEKKIVTLLEKKYPAVAYFTIGDRVKLAQAVKSYFAANGEYAAAKKILLDCYPQAKASMNIDELDFSADYQYLRSKINNWYLTAGQKNHIKSIVKFTPTFTARQDVRNFFLQLQNKVKLRDSDFKINLMGKSSRFRTILLGSIQYLNFDFIGTNSNGYNSSPNLLVVDKQYNFSTYARMIADNPAKQLSSDDSSYIMDELLNLQDSNLLKLENNEKDLQTIAELLVFENGNLKNNDIKHSQSPNRISLIENKLTQLQYSENGSDAYAVIQYLMEKLPGKSSDSQSIINVLPKALAKYEVAALSEEMTLSSLPSQLKDISSKIEAQRNLIAEHKKRIEVLEKTEKDLQQLLVRQVAVALCHYSVANKSTSFFNRIFSRHGAYGKKVAEDFLLCLQQAPSFDDAKTLVVSFLQRNPTLRNHSFATFLLRELWSDCGVLGRLCDSDNKIPDEKSQWMLNTIDDFSSCYEDSRFKDKKSITTVDNMVHELSAKDEVATHHVPLIVAKSKQINSGALSNMSSAFADWLGLNVFSSAQRSRQGVAQETIRLFNHIV
jgi:hypothetical protein